MRRTEAFKRAVSGDYDGVLCSVARVRFVEGFVRVRRSGCGAGRALESHGDRSVHVLAGFGRWSHRGRVQDELQRATEAFSLQNRY